MTVTLSHLDLLGLGLVAGLCVAVAVLYGVLAVRLTRHLRQEQAKTDAMRRDLAQLLDALHAAVRPTVPHVTVYQHDGARLPAYRNGQDYRG